MTEMRTTGSTPIDHVHGVSLAPAVAAAAALLCTSASGAVSASGIRITSHGEKDFSGCHMALSIMPLQETCGKACFSVLTGGVSNKICKPCVHSAEILRVVKHALQQAT